MAWSWLANSLQIIELDGASGAPQLLPAPHEIDPALMLQEVQLALSSAENSVDDKESSNEAYLESVTTVKSKRGDSQRRCG